MLRIIEVSNSMPISFPVSPDAVFSAGTAMTLTSLGSQIFAVPSNGMSFIGVADDVKETAFSAVSWDEQVRITPHPNNITLNGANQLILLNDVKAELENPNVDGNYFVSNPVPVQLIPRNGVVVFPAGTPLNTDLDGDGTPDTITTLVRYPYMIPNVAGDNTTAGSQMVTIWATRMLFECDTFETNQSYNVMSNLFINDRGLFTTRQILPNSPVIAICTAPPSVINPTLQALLL